VEVLGSSGAVNNTNVTFHVNISGRFVRVSIGGVKRVRELKESFDTATGVFGTSTIESMRQ
jgi:hypothetical protein